MQQTPSNLRFLWWNLNNFTHYEKDRVGQGKWPRTSEDYAVKLDRVAQALREICLHPPCEILAFAEVTRTAALHLRDRVFPTHEVFSLDDGEDSTPHLAFLHLRMVGFESQPKLLTPQVPPQTRPGGVLD